MLVSVSASRTNMRWDADSAGVDTASASVMNSNDEITSGVAMNLVKKFNPFRTHLKGSCRPVFRQFSVLAAVAMILAACALDNEGERGTIGFIEGFIGGVAADEPRAALIGRDILAAGGTAADAAVAVYFTLAVTMPSAASIGGGGVCLIHDPENSEVVALDFLARAPAEISAGVSRPSAIPGNPRGFYAMHARYGVLRWQQLVSPAASLARFGTQVSRALARDLSVASEALLVDAQIAAIFTSPKTGQLVDEGEFLKQVDLSIILGRMGLKGPGDFYAGQGAKNYVDAVIRAGGSLSVEDLRTYLPVWRDTIKVEAGNQVMHFAPPPAAAGVVGASMWQMMTQEDRYADAPEEERPHLIAETAMRAYADRARWMVDGGETRWSASELSDPTRLQKDMATYNPNRHTPMTELAQKPARRSENPSGTSFVVVDKNGGAVACSLTMNNLFGAGRIAPGTGVVLATVPGKGGRGAMSLVPMIVANIHTSNLYWAGAASGGVAAPTSLMNVAAQSILAEHTMETAMTAHRVHHGGQPDTTYYEIGLAPDKLDGLKRRGHQSAGAPSIGRVNAMSCFSGLPDHPETCEIATDPRGFGLALSADKI